MHIEAIQIKDFRILNNVSFNPGRTINLITGHNGAGKTSLLETIYILARGKSFRTKSNKKLINHQKNSFHVSSSIKNSIGMKKKIGISANHKNTEIMLSGKKLDRLSSLAQNLPMGIVTPNTHKILEEGPVYRRKLLNWGVFHVEHKYAQLLRQYNKILLQRNTAIRNKGYDYSIWNKQLNDIAVTIKDIRSNYIQDWLKYIFHLSESFEDLSQLAIEHKAGWDQNQSLLEILQNKTSVDEKRGFTTQGIHRADLIITIDQKPANERLSRGQQKILGFILIFSQLMLYAERIGENPIFLFDDLYSELDKDKIQHLVRIIHDSRFQAFITAMDLDNIDNLDRQEFAMFHVEQGTIKEVFEG